MRCRLAIFVVVNCVRLRFQGIELAVDASLLLVCLAAGPIFTMHKLTSVEAQRVIAVMEVG